MNLYAYVGGDPVNFIDPEGRKGFAFDMGGAYGTGNGTTDHSSSGLAGTGIYIGATGPSNYGEIGGFSYTGSGETWGAEIGIGPTFTYYNTDAKDFFKGTLDYKSVNIAGVAYVEYYNECGELGSLSILGKGAGFSTGSGKVHGHQGVLQ